MQNRVKISLRDKEPTAMPPVTQDNAERCEQDLGRIRTSDSTVRVVKNSEATALD
jgi:hypothetical protein